MSKSRKKRFGGKRGSYKGNYLRVRSNSTTSKGNVQGLSGVSNISNAAHDSSEHFDYFYKIIVIGDEGVGKTNFLLRISKGYYEA